VTEAEVRGRIAVFCDVDSDPTLSSEDVDVLVSMAKRLDDNGINPSEETWTPTWNVNYAIAQGWLLKSSRLAPHYLFMSGGKMFSRNQYFDHCMKLYHKFMSRAGMMAQRLGPEVDDFLAVPNNWNAG
jgi:hypothetical protein